MSYIHLTISERVKIETLADLNYSIRELAQKLGRSPSTVSRKVKRCESDGPYQVESAQETYAGKKKRCCAKSKGTEETLATVQQKLNETWSPEQIANRLFEGRPYFKTIYRWISEGLIQVPLTVLRQKGKRRKPQETRDRFTIGTPIVKRPKEVRKRETFGHWELDTVVSSRGKAKPVPLPSSNVKAAGTPPSKWWTALQPPWRRRFIPCAHAFRKTVFSRQPPIGAKNSTVIAHLKKT